MFGIIPISSNEERSKTVILLFRIYIILLFCSVLTELGVAITMHGRDNILAMSGRIMIIGAGILAIIKGIFYIVIAVYFIMWLRRAYHNLHKAGSPYLRHSEGWAAGAWFVPFLNLAWPLQIVRDTWTETQNVFRRQGELYEKEEDKITGWWWAMFLFSGFVSYIGSLLINSKNFEPGYAFTAVGNIGYIFSASLLISMVRKIRKMETEMMERAHQFYAWQNQQQGEKYQQQNSNPVNPTPQHPDGGRNQQEDFYQP